MIKDPSIITRLINLHLMVLNSFAVILDGIFYLYLLSLADVYFVIDKLSVDILYILHDLSSC